VKISECSDIAHPFGRHFFDLPAYLQIIRHARVADCSQKNSGHRASRGWGAAVTASDEQLSPFIADMAVAPQQAISARRSRPLYARPLREHIVCIERNDPLR
jgi:hypothetical protein